MLLYCYGTNTIFHTVETAVAEHHSNLATHLRVARPISLQPLTSRANTRMLITRRCTLCGVIVLLLLLLLLPHQTSF